LRRCYGAELAPRCCGHCAANKLIDDNDEINTKSLPQVKNAEPGQFHRQVPAPDLAWYTLRLE
jgi:hypothetical protein